MELAITLLGLFASACFITMNYVLDKKTMLITQSLGMLSVGSQFGFKGIFGVTVVNFVFIVRNLIVYLRDKRWDAYDHATMFSKNKREERIQLGFLFLIVVVAIYFLVTELPKGDSFTSYGVFMFPLLAAITNVFALAQQNLLPLKLWIVTSTTCWVIFDLMVGSWQNLIGDIFGFVAGTLAIAKLTLFKKDDIIN